MFHNILEPGFYGIAFGSNEDFRIMRPQCLAANVMVRGGGGRDRPASWSVQAAECGWQKTAGRLL